METVIANPWVRKGLRLINSKGMTCLLRGLYSSVDFQVYQSIVQIGKKTIYAYGGARTHSLAQQKCMGETLERIAIKLHMKHYEFAHIGTAGAFNKKDAIERARFELLEKQAFSKFLQKNVSTYKRVEKITNICITGSKIPYTFMCIRPFEYKGNKIYATGLCTKRSKPGAKKGAAEEACIEMIVKQILLDRSQKNNSKHKIFIHDHLVEKNSLTYLNLTPNFYKKIRYQIWLITENR